MVDLKVFTGYEYVSGGVCAAKGFIANGICCGLAHKALSAPAEKEELPESDVFVKKKNDLAVIFAENDCTAAAVYTTNKVKGAPVVVTKKHLTDGHARAVIVNSVNANCCNSDGEQKAEQMCDLLAKALNISPNDVIVASTGVIGQTLPIEPIRDAVGTLCEGLSEEGFEEACEAIMTTDTCKKQLAVSFELDGKKVTIGGMLKGSGMIHPNMATTLTFITTDAAIAPEYLQRALSDIVADTLNMVSVDGDTSTNDMVCILASGASGNKCISHEDRNCGIFRNALYIIMLNLARMMARDGEGATKLIECVCTGANDDTTARAVAKSVICSSLFKAAIFGEDANWGRVLCAVGYSGGDFEISDVALSISSKAGCIKVCENGMGVEFSEELAKKVLSEEEINLHVSVGKGTSEAIAWGCDLTYDYVKINGDYRS